MGILEVLEEERQKFNFRDLTEDECRFVWNWIKRDLEEQAEEFAEFGKGTPSVEDKRKLIAIGMKECINLFKNVDSGKGMENIKQVFGR